MIFTMDGLAAVGRPAPGSDNSDAAQARLTRRDKLNASRARVAAQRGGGPSRRVSQRDGVEGEEADKEALKQLRMLRNRESAALSRKRNDDEIKSLERQVETLEEKNRRLRAQLAHMRDVGDVPRGTCPLSRHSAPYEFHAHDMGGHPSTGTPVDGLESARAAASIGTAPFPHDDAGQGFDTLCGHQHYYQQQPTRPHHFRSPQVQPQCSMHRSQQGHASFGEVAVNEFQSEPPHFTQREMMLISSFVEAGSGAQPFDEVVVEPDMRGTHGGHRSGHDATPNEYQPSEPLWFAEQMIGC